jgi:predicted metalloendopeptidase
MNHRFSLVNAWYEKAYNQLWITPAYIMAPLFDQEQNEATLYATAYVFAHEISHGFGGGGSYYDEVGNYRDWWTAEDRTAFEQKQQQMITLYNQLEAYPGQPANGEKTLNENMADLGGVTLALEAYKRRLKKQGFSGEQLDEQLRKFWLSYVMVIGADYYERNLDMLKWNYLHDSHSAGHNRINGIARLIDDWYRLYDVKPTDKLYLAPEDRVKIW